MPIDRPKVAKLLLPTELKAVPRVPLRPEMSQEEIERYPERLRRHEERAALARQAETPEAVDHRKTCQSEGCADPAHDGLFPRLPRCRCHPPSQTCHRRAR